MKLYNSKYNQCIILDRIENISIIQANKKAMISLIALTYFSSFSRDLFDRYFIESKFNALVDYLLAKQCYLLIARNQNKIIGFCHYFIKDDFEGRRGHLNQIAVMPKFQGSKYFKKSKTKQNRRTSIAKEFILIMERHLKKQNIFALDLLVSTQNLKAINLYQNIGFCEHRKIMLKKFHSNFLLKQTSNAKQTRNTKQ